MTGQELQQVTAVLVGEVEVIQKEDQGAALGVLATADEEVQEAVLTAFFKEELYRTRDETGILIFISVFEHKVWVLADRGITVYRTDMGTYLTVQEMAGFSVTMMKLDDELKRYLDLSCDSFGFKQS